MSLEVEFGIPGEVAFSYVHIKGTPEELGLVNYEMLGALFTSAMFSHKQAEKAAIERLKNGETALLSPPPEKGGERAEEEYERLLMEELGASEVGDTVKVGGLEFTKKQESPFPEHNEAPYKAAPPAAVKPKPWESNKPVPTVTVDVTDW